MKICELNCYQTNYSPLCRYRCVIACLKMLKLNSSGKPWKKISMCRYYNAPVTLSRNWRPMDTRIWKFQFRTKFGPNCPELGEKSINSRSQYGIYTKPSGAHTKATRRQRRQHECYTMVLDAYTTSYWETAPECLVQYSVASAVRGE